MAIRYATGIASILVISGLLGACMEAKASNTKAPESVIVGTYKGSDGGLLEDFANQKGMMKGLDLQEVQVINGAAMAALLLGNTAAISIMPPATAIPLIARGEPIVFLTGEVNSDYALIAGKNVKLKHAGEDFPKSLLDLKGRKIGISALGAATDMVARKLVESAGLDPHKDVTYIATGGPPTAVAALASGQTDFQIAFLPMREMLGSGQYQLVSELTTGPAGALFKDFMTLGYATTQKEIDEHPEVVKKFCDGIWAAYHYTQDPANNKEVLAFLSKHMNLDMEKTTAIWARVRSKFDPSLSEARWYAQGNYLTSPIDMMSKAQYAKHVYKPCANPR